MLKSILNYQKMIYLNEAIVQKMLEDYLDKNFNDSEETHESVTPEEIDKVFDNKPQAAKSPEPEAPKESTKNTIDEFDKLFNDKK